MSGIQPSDFVGYRVGSPAGAPAATAGFIGLLDFLGFPVGAAVAAAVEKVKLVRGPLPKRKRKHDDEEELLLLI